MLQPSLCLSDLELPDDGLADVTQRESPLFAAEGDVPHNVAQLILDGSHPLRGHLTFVAPHLLDLLGDLTGLAAEAERRVHLSHHVATAGVDSRRPSQMLEVEECIAPLRTEVINTSHRSTAGRAVSSVILIRDPTCSTTSSTSSFSMPSISTVT